MPNDEPPRLIHEDNRHEASVETARFHPEGHIFATCVTPSVSSSRILASIPPTCFPRRCDWLTLHFTTVPFFFSGSKDGTVRLWHRSRGWQPTRMDPGRYGGMKNIWCGGTSAEGNHTSSRFDLYNFIHRSADSLRLPWSSQHSFPHLFYPSPLTLVLYFTPPGFYGASGRRTGRFSPALSTTMRRALATTSVCGTLSVCSSNMYSRVTNFSLQRFWPTRDCPT